MSSDNPFEYKSRWDRLGDMLLSGNEEEIRAALRALETRDRDLEDFMRTIGGGGTAQSILSFDSDQATHDVDPSTGTTYNYTNLAFDVPDDPSFTYYLDWFINGKLELNGAGGTATCTGYAKIQEQLPGVGFETFYGFVSQGLATSGNPYFVSGVGSRMELVSAPLLGTTIHLDVTFVTSASVSQRLRDHQFWQARLVAIPA